MRLATSNTAARATRTSSNTLSLALASSTEQPESCAGVRDKTDWPWDLTSRRFPADRTAGVLLYAVCSADSPISHLGVAPSSDCDIGYFLLSSDVFSLQLSLVPVSGSGSSSSPHPQAPTCMRILPIFLPKYIVCVPPYDVLYICSFVCLYLDVRVSCVRPMMKCHGALWATFVLWYIQAIHRVPLPLRSRIYKLNLVHVKRRCATDSSLLSISSFAQH